MKTCNLLLLLFVFAGNVYAQKLLNVQPLRLVAPANIKIDGNINEWGNNIKGYNHPTGFYYNITNDKKSLYLIIHAIDPSVARKIIGGGISFTIHTSGKKNQKDAPRLTFPVFDEHAKQYINYNRPVGTNPLDAYPDSIISVNNKRLSGMAKTISFRRGSDAAADTLVSVYNNYGLQAAMRFDNKMALTVEMAINLALIKQNIDLTGKILYHVESNGMEPINLNGYNIVYNANGTTKMEVTPGALTARDFEDAPHTTDFWGEYTLAK